MSATPPYLLLGEILRPHGVRGELRVRLMTDYPDRMAKLKQVYIGRGIDAPNIKPYHVEYMRMHHGYGLLKLREIPDRTAGESMRGLFIMIDIANAVPLEEGEFYLFQLIGVTVETEDGETLGTLTEVLETGANDVYIVKSPRYGEVLIPVIPDTIVRTDIADRRVIVRLPDGLLATDSDDTD